MQISLICPSCFDEILSGTGKNAPDFDVPLGDTHIYDATCPSGHSVKQIVVNPKFELLFESGIKALELGYFREAVSSFAASLERFYEFLIQGHFIENRRLSNGFTDAWKTLSKQSERQIGAFCMLYLRDFKHVAPMLDVKFIKNAGISLEIKGDDPVHFRNIATHQGYIPKREQAMGYGEAVNRYIHHMLVHYCSNGKAEELNAALINNTLSQDDGIHISRRNATLIHSSRYIWNTDAAFNQEYFSLEAYLALKPSERACYWYQ